MDYATTETMLRGSERDIEQGLPDDHDTKRESASLLLKSLLQSAIDSRQNRDKRNSSKDELVFKTVTDDDNPKRLQQLEIPTWDGFSDDSDDDATCCKTKRSSPPRRHSITAVNPQYDSKPSHDPQQGAFKEHTPAQQATAQHSSLPTSSTHAFCQRLSGREDWLRHIGLLLWERQHIVSTRTTTHMHRIGLQLHDEMGLHKRGQKWLSLALPHFSGCMPDGVRNCIMRKHHGLCNPLTYSILTRSYPFVLTSSIASTSDIHWMYTTQYRHAELKRALNQQGRVCSITI